MQVKVEIVGPESNIPPSDRKSINVEFHAKRGDMFHVVRGETVLEGDPVKTYDIPPGGRLIINTPEAHEEMVYDKEQGAAIRASAQSNNAGRADRVSDNIRQTQPVPPPSRVTPAPAQTPQPRVQTQQQPQPAFQAPGTPPSGQPTPAFQPPGSKGDSPDPATKEGKDK